MQLLPQAQEFWDCIHGRPIEKVPNFEFFFDNPAITEHFIGRQINGIDDAIEFAEAIGWGAVRAGSCWYNLGIIREEASDGMHHYAGGTPLSREEFARLKQPNINDRVAEAIEKIPKIQNAGLLSFVFVSHCFHAVATGLGLEHFCMMCYDDLPFMCELMAVVEENNRRFLNALFDAGVQPHLVFFDADCAYKSAMMVNPEIYRVLTFAETKKTCRLLQERAISYLFHSDGAIDQWYPILIELGAAGAHSIEKQANNLGTIKEKFGNQLTLIGNFDPVFIANRSPEEIYREAVRMVQIGKPGGRYMAGINTIVMDYVPLENYLAFLEAVHDAGRY